VSAGDEHDEEAPGWDAIDAAFEALYPGQKPEHWGTLLPERVIFGGPEVIDGISAYEATMPRPHWHWVTYGLTDLYHKEGDDPDWSGWGYELVMRAPRDELWPRDALRQIANWAHRTKTLLGAGEYMDVRGPLVAGVPCELAGWATAADRALPTLQTPHGRVEFLDVIGLHPEEIAFWVQRGAEATLERLARTFAGELNVLVRDAAL